METVQKCSDARHAKIKLRGVYEYTLSDAVCSTSGMRRIHSAVFEEGIEYLVGVSISSTAKNALCGMLTEPIIFMRFFPAFCFQKFSFPADIAAITFGCYVFTESADGAAGNDFTGPMAP